VSAAVAKPSRSEEWKRFISKHKKGSVEQAAQVKTCDRGNHQNVLTLL
jgi:hypothetical protein